MITAKNRFFPGLFTFILLVSCATRNDLDPQRWHGRTLSGQEVSFSALKTGVIVLNVYSPDCRTCTGDLETVNRLYRAVNEMRIPFYIIVEGNPAAHGLNGPGARRDLEEKLRADVKRFAMEPPVVIMSSAFQIAPTGSLIRGTPETWILATRPLTPIYGFVGSLSVAPGGDKIEEDSRFQFVRQKILREIRRDRARAVKKR